MRKIKKIDLSKDEEVVAISVIKEEIRRNTQILEMLNDGLVEIISQELKSDFIAEILFEDLKDGEPVNEAHESLLAKVQQLCERH